jgi:type II secretion system protein G
MKKGFTLIELLIVVAIIAILAAIAVPNFLEAQTRAKVSRELSDMRSVATALEAYRIDNNHYPASVTFSGSSLRVLWSAVFDTPTGKWGHITTPISYMTSVPTDVFNDYTTHWAVHAKDVVGRHRHGLCRAVA